MSLCPSILETLSIGTPLERAMEVAKECLAIWKVKTLSILQIAAISFK